jgi:hypothetical protein
VGDFRRAASRPIRSFAIFPTNLSTVIHSSFLWHLGWEIRTKILTMVGMVNQMPEVNGSFRHVGTRSCNKTSVIFCPRNIRVTFSVAPDRAMIIDDRAR